MFAEYARLLTKDGGEGLLSIDSVTGVVILLAAGFLLVFIGFKLKGAVGAVVALLLGAIGYLFVTGVIRF